MLKKKILILSLLSVMAMTGCTNSAPAQTETASETTLQTETVSETTETTTEATTTTVTTTAPTETTTEATTTELPFEDTPENAYQRLMLSFTTPEGNEIPPDDYAGVYSFMGTMFVLTTSDEPSEYYTDLLGEYTCISYKTVTHSFNELTWVCQRAWELLDGTEFAPQSYYIDVPSNKAAMVIEGNPKQAQNYLKTLPELDFELGMLELIIAEDE
ncbi:MAG: hypothetical protein ACI4Q6_08670 [Huintestinicola sp.]